MLCILYKYWNLHIIQFDVVAMKHTAVCKYNNAKL